MSYAAIGVAGVGLVTSIIGSSKAKREQRRLEDMANKQKPNESIMDYYNKALARYNTNPYTSASYRNASEQAGKGLATGLNALQDRRSALGGVNELVQQYNDSNQQAAANAEQMQAQQLGQLGQAAGAKTGEERYPFELKYNLSSAKAGGYNQVANAGLTNVFNAGTNLAERSMIDRMYGGNGNIFSRRK